MRLSAERFDNYREITAKRAGDATCGHVILVGDPIGWNPRTKNTQCDACWARWTRENIEAEQAERGQCW